MASQLVASDHAGGVEICYALHTLVWPDFQIYLSPTSGSKAVVHRYKLAAQGAEDASAGYLHCEAWKVNCFERMGMSPRVSSSET